MKLTLILLIAVVTLQVSFGALNLGLGVHVNLPILGCQPPPPKPPCQTPGPIPGCEPTCGEVCRTKQYVEVNQLRNWSDARADCIARGMVLATFMSAAENAAAQALVGGLGLLNHWTGGTDQNSLRTFYWDSTGILINSCYTNWYTGEPNNVLTSCIEFYDNGFWNDDDCTDLKPYICQTCAAC